VTDRERGSLLSDEDPIGAMRLASTVKFGQRAAALGGVPAADAQADAGLFDSSGALNGTWTEHWTCTSTNLQ